MPTTPDWKLETFDWLPLKKWTPVELFGDQVLDGKRYCKICDVWEAEGGVELHCEHHVKEMLGLKKRKAREGEKNRKEALALARAEKRRLREAS